MNNNSKLDEWWFDDTGSVRAQINAVYEGGVFIDQDTGLPIKPTDGTRAKILLSSNALSDNERKHHDRVEKKEMLPKGSELFFRFKIPGEGEGEFKVILREDLSIERKGNKFGKLSFAPCDVYDAISGKLITHASSLNEAYTRTSIAMRPEARTHTANAFKVFYYKGDSLEKLRPF